MSAGTLFAKEAVQEPNVSGQFYSSNSAVLSKQIDGFFNNATCDPSLQDKDIRVLISPHAGYEYSGQVAAHAFKAIQGRNYDAVIVIAPSHFQPLKGIAVYPEGAFRTPLGDIEIDAQLTQALANEYPEIQKAAWPFEREHALEVQLPFLQKALGNFKLVSVMVGQINYEQATAFAKALQRATQGKRVLIVASTDMSHYHPYAQAVAKDTKTLSYICAIDAAGLWKSCRKGETELCGINPVSIALCCAQLEGLQAQQLAYANSGDVSGDKSRVVGYCSVALFQDEAASQKSVDKGEMAMFSESQKKRLLEIARQSMTEYITSGKQMQFKEEDPQLQVKRGAFVTLHKRGQLRGCIGTFTSNEPIYQVIATMVIESATGDPRFPAVQAGELGDIDVEISVLTEPQVIDDWRKIRLGVDGVIVRSGFASGVFLPQVATETGWDLETFLQHLCSGKAGLPSDAYKDPRTQISTFQAVIFSEK